MDNHLFNDNVIEIYRNKQIHLLNYSKWKKMVFSTDLIEDLNEDNYIIQHSCSISEDLLGGKFINLINF